MTFCTNCGKKLTSGAARCEACGVAIPAARQTPPESQQGQSNPKMTSSETTLPLKAIGQQVGRVLGGRYQLTQVIGSGGMGEIYRARRTHIGDTVAVKVLRADVVENEKSRQRFYREARAAAMLHHPNAVVIHDFGEDTDGTAYIVMELLEGRNLRQVLIDEGSVSALRCYGIIRQTCAALDAGHRNGIIHRDIKPDNIFLLDSNDGADHVKILDFGIAKLRDQALDTLSMEQRLTNVGTVIGTPHYMAPEQCQGEEADARSDIYSLGVVLYELLTGVAPFLAKTPTGVAIKHVTEKPRPLREIQPAVTETIERVVLRALEKEPSVRQQSALELAREFEAAIRADGATDTLVRSGEQPQVDPGTLPMAKSPKTEVISKPQDTGANRAAPAPPQSFETRITPPSGTAPVASNLTGERSAPSDSLRTQVIPPTEMLAAEPAVEAPKEIAPPHGKPAPIDPLRTDPFIPADEAAKQVAAYEAKADPRPRDEKKEEKKAKREKIEVPLAPPPSLTPGSPVPVPAKSRATMFVGLGAGLLVLVGIAAWMMSGGDSPTPQPVATATPAIAASVAPSPTATSAFPEVTAPDGMVYVLGGALRVGRDDGEENERPAHVVTVKPFFMDRTEVTNEQYQKFVDATGHAAPAIWKGTHFPENADKLPVTDVSWEDATAYAEWAGKRLPAEEEWEFAARGDQARLFPWGDTWKADTANVTAGAGESRDLMPVGQFIQGASPFGLLDLVGNAWEWTASDYQEYPGGKVEAPPAGFKNMKVIRGGSFQSSAKKATATLRRGWPASAADWPPGRNPEYAQTGFRCAQDVKEP